MAKTKKKRTKSYHGTDAKTAKPQVVHIHAENRNTLQQWLYERQKLMRPVLVGLAIVVLLVLIAIGLAGLFSPHS